MQEELLIQISKDIKCLLLCNKPFLNIDELCLYSGLSKDWVYKLTSNKIIPHCKLPTGKIIVFKRSEIDDWLLSQPVLPFKKLEQIEFEMKYHKQETDKLNVKIMKASKPKQTLNKIEFPVTHYYQMKLDKENQDIIQNFYSGYYSTLNKNGENIDPMLLMMCHNSLLLLLDEINIRSLDFNVINTKNTKDVNIGIAFDYDDFVLLFHNEVEITILVFEGQANNSDTITKQFKNGKLTPQPFYLHRCLRSKLSVIFETRRYQAAHRC